MNKYTTESNSTLFSHPNYETPKGYAGRIIVTKWFATFESIGSFEVSPLCVYTWMHPPQVVTKQLIIGYKNEFPQWLREFISHLDMVSEDREVTREFAQIVLGGILRRWENT